MNLAMIAAGVVLAPDMQPKPTAPVRRAAVSRVYRWIAVPGGSIVPVSFPFTLLVPVPVSQDAFDSATVEFTITMGQEASAKKGGFSKAFAEKYKSVLTDSWCDKTKTDPKLVLDPVMSGF
ncbi:MAG: hypothetical protein JST30_04875 [Armatimonadetes bacterium]|nr:hypothetical protein [Armatimonadota bacterium]